MEKYCDLIVGRRGLGRLLLYELVTLFAPFPGALGLWLRSKLYPLVLKRCGKNVTFGVNVSLRHPHKIAIGDNVVIDDFCLLDAKGDDNRGISIAGGVFVGRGTILSCKNGDIFLEENVNLGFNCEIFSGSTVTLRRDILVAAYTYFIGGGHESGRTDIAVLRQPRTSLGIEAGEGAWFGAGVRVLDGVKVGGHAIIGAGAVVSSDVPEYAVAAGIPARVIRDRREGK